ncbi:MAG: signal peptidase I [Opitutales bacterium]
MKKLRKQAKELLQAANKVYHYRRDQIPEARLSEMIRAVEEVQELRNKPAEHSDALRAAIDRLDARLRKDGGKIYPKTFWNDNLEVGLVAAILVIGIRSFFFQPFIIPTNSMYPTYSGMHAVIYEQTEDAPNPIEKMLRLATLGARHKSVTAETSGALQIPMRMDQNGGLSFYVEKVKGRKFFILPAVRARYTFYIDETPHTLTVPAEFDMGSALARAFDLSSGNLRRVAGEDNLRLLELDEQFEAGEDILRFDITLGDALFVDRFSYHFREPQVGDPFVFRTNNIPEALAGDVEKYYIKRLAGTGGETLEIRDGHLLVNGRPRDEVEAFERNAAREEGYHGYMNIGKLAEGDQMVIPEDFFVALGDNSGNSKDSRYWGFVPEKSVIGKAFFIYYPFTRRWGLAE